MKNTCRFECQFAEAKVSEKELNPLGGTLGHAAVPSLSCTAAHFISPLASAAARTQFDPLFPLRFVMPTVNILVFSSTGYF